MPKITHHSVDSDLKEYVKIKPDLDSVRSQLADNTTNINDRGINVKDKSFGAKGDGVTDDTTAIQNAYNSLLPYQTLIIPNGTYMVTNLVFDKSDIEIRCFGLLKQKSATTGSTVKIGRTDISLFRVSGNLKVEKETRDWTQDNTGIHVINCNELDLNVYAKGFTRGFKLEGNNNGTAYNSFYIKSVSNCKYGIDFLKVGAGWVTENKFFSGRFQWGSSVPIGERSGARHVNITDVTMNNNVFFSPSFETDGGTFIYCNGQYNTFYSPRLEGVSTIANFDTNSNSNVLMHPLYGANFETTGELIDIGLGNKIYARETIKFNNTQIKSAGFKATGKKSNYTNQDGVIEAYETVSNTNKTFVGYDKTGVSQVFYVNGYGDGVFSRDLTSRYLKLGNFYLWTDSSGKLRINSVAPVGSTEENSIGTVVGTQA